MGIASDWCYGGRRLESCLVHWFSVVHPGQGVHEHLPPRHQCGPGSIPSFGVIRGLSLLVLYSALRGFSPGTPVFPSPQKPTFDLICVNC